MSFCQLWLTCEGAAEADTIAHALLDKKLIACAKQIPITADFAWMGEKEHADEILLIMESRLDLFKSVDKIVDSLHSYDTYVLQALPILSVSKGAAIWLDEVLKQNG